MSVGSVAFWVARVHGTRLDRADFEDGKPGFAWNRTSAVLERRVLALRSELRGSVLISVCEAVARLFHGGGRRLRRTTDAVGKSVAKHFTLVAA